MTLALDNPGLLPLAVLVGLPVLIHLIARPRARPLGFPSLMLLREAQRETLNLRRPRHWLLLALRTLWVFLLLATFLQPRWFTRTPPSEIKGDKTLVVVLDATASMRAREGTQTRYSSAVNETVALLRQLSPGDRANVIRVRAIPESLYAAPGVNRDYLIEQLRARACSREGGDIPEALRVAAEQLAEAPGRKEIVLVSDFQPPEEGVPLLLTVPADVELTLLPAAAEEIPNQAVVALTARPAQPVAGEPFQLLADVHNFSDTAVSRPLSLRVGERHEQTLVDLPPRHTERVVFDLVIDDETSLPVTAELEPDAFPVDDARHLILPMRPEHRIGIHGRDDPTARIWRRTVNALPGARAVDIDSPATLPADLDLLLLSDWRGEGLDRVRRFVESGRPLFFKPAEVTEAMSDWLGLPAGAWSPTRLDPPLALRVASPHPEALRLFEDGEFGNPERALVSRHAMRPLSETPLRPILSLENGDPVWAELPRVPGVTYWNLNLDPEENTLPARPEWVPMFGEALRHAFRASETLSATAGDLLPVSTRAFEPGALRLESLAGDPLEIQEADGAVSAAEPPPPGIYRWIENADGGIHALRAVNLPPSESRLASLPPETREGDAFPALEHAAQWTTQREGRPLWPWLLAAAFLIAALEHALTQREART